MRILGIEKVSMVDYPNKIATTLFTGGCNFRCPFCHNSGIVEQKYTAIDPNDIFEYLQGRKNLIDAVVISGGEPTLQPDLEEFIIKLKQLGYLIKLDTNGTNPFVLKNLLDKNLLDYVAMDIKNNFGNYSAITGVKDPKIENVKVSLSLLKNSGINYELRTTLVENFHKEDNIKKMAQELAGEKLLYLQKFVSSDNCIKQGLAEVPKTTAAHYAEILSSTIDNVFLRGY